MHVRVLILLAGLRGAATLKQRAADLRGISSSTSSNAVAMSISAGIKKGTTLRVCLPCGETEVHFRFITNCASFLVCSLV